MQLIIQYCVVCSIIIQLRSYCIAIIRLHVEYIHKYNNISSNMYNQNFNQCSSHEHCFKLFHHMPAINVHTKPRTPDQYYNEHLITQPAHTHHHYNAYSEIQNELLCSYAIMPHGLQLYTNMIKPNVVRSFTPSIIFLLYIFNN